MNQEPPYSSPYPPQASSPQEVVVQQPQRQPVVTYTILAVTVLVYLLQMATESFLLGVDLPAMWGMKVNELIIAGQFWRLITPVLLHGSILHIAFNMYALISFGPGLERYYGHGRFVALYLISGFAGNVFSFLFSSAPSLGSSTAIFGLLGAEGVFLYQNRKLFGRGAQRALINLITIAVINLFIGLSNPGIDNWGHLGGLMGGILFAWFAGPLLDVEQNAFNYTLTDRRGSGTSLRAGVGVAALFFILAMLGVYLRS